MPAVCLQPPFATVKMFSETGAVEGFAGRRSGFVKFDEAGGGRGVRGDVGPCKGQVGAALEE